MKAVMISINPKWCEKIASGEKTIEVRKTRPKMNTPFKCYIYCTQAKTIGDIILCKSEENTKLFGYNTVKGINKGFAENEDIKLKGKVIGEFVCDNIYPIKNQGSDFVIANATKCETNEIARQSCLDYDDMVSYLGNKDGYAWHISDLVIYEQPKALSEFKTLCKSYYEGDNCDDCKYFIDCRGYEYDESDCACNGLKPIERPPQSWQFVEEKDEMIEENEMIKRLQSALPDTETMRFNFDKIDLATYLYDAGCRIVGEDEIVIKKSEHKALLLEQKRLKEMVDRIPCGYVKIAEDEIVVKKSKIGMLEKTIDYLEMEKAQLNKQLEQAEQEVSREILQELYDEAISYVCKTVELTAFQIEQLAKEKGVELE